MLWSSEWIRLMLFLQALLEVVNDLFEEQTDLEKIVRKIMQRALTLLQCERCSVLLLEDIHSPVRLSFILRKNYSHIFFITFYTFQMMSIWLEKFLNSTWSFLWNNRSFFAPLFCLLRLFPLYLAGGKVLQDVWAHVSILQCRPWHKVSTPLHISNIGSSLVV